MIAKLDNQNTIRDNFKVTFDYHESKVERGVSEKIYSNMLTDDIKTQRETFDYYVKSNTRVKIKGFDIPFSFHSGDLVTNESFLNVWDHYAKEMNMDNHPVVIYRDYDTEHVHFHVIVTNLSFSQEANKKLHGFYKKDSTRLCREIERKFGFKNLKEMNNEKKERLSSRNIRAENYSYLSTFEKMDKKELFNLGISEKEHASILATKPKNVEFFNGLNPNVKIELIKKIESKPYFYQSAKSKIIKILDAKLRLADSNESYFKLLDEEDSIYRRILIDRKTKKPYIRYGFKPGDKYFSEIDLPPRFSLSKINKLAIKRATKPSVNQEKKYLKNIVSKAFRNSKSYDEFKQECLKSEIILLESSNSSGVYGVSFENQSIEDGSTFKGSELGISFNKLNKEFNIKEDEIIEDIALESPSFTESILPDVLGNTGKTGKDDEEIPLRKRRKGKKR